MKDFVEYWYPADPEAKRNGNNINRKHITATIVYRRLD